LCGKGLVFSPIFLPFGFDLFVEVFHFFEVLRN